MNKIFEIKTLKAIIIKQLFEVIKPYLKETNIFITNEYIKICTIDNCKNTLTYIKLDSSKFESYYCKRPINIGVNTELFYKAIKSVSRRETITFTMYENNLDKLEIELCDAMMGKIKKYTLVLLDLGIIKNPKIDDIEYDSIINIPTKQFQQIVKDIYSLDGQMLEIKSIKKQVIFSCNDGNAKISISISEVDDNENMEQKMLLQQNGEDLRNVKFTKSTNKIVQGNYKIAYLMNFIKASHLCENMNIFITNDKPLVLEYFIADLGILRLLLMSE